MSEPRLPAPHPPGPDKLPSTAITAVLGAAVLLFAVGIWAADSLHKQKSAEMAEIGGLAAPPEKVGAPEIGMVDQQLFELEHRAADERAAQLKRLHAYGWVDREKKIIHLPIEAAMESVLAEQKR